MAVSKVILNGTTLIDTTDKTVTNASMLSGVTALKNDGTTATGNIASKSSTDLTVSGATVTAPAGYYSSSASKSVASGSATTPTTSITANPTISVSSGGLITASVSGSKSVTPTVSAGWVSSGTAGTVSVSGSNTEQLTTQAAATYHPSTTDQTIASGKYLTGAQTIKAVTTTNLTAANIAEGVTVKIGDSTDDDCVASITGTHQGGTTPTGVKYVYSDVDGIGAWDVSGFEKCSVDGAPLNDGHLRLWFYFPSDAIPFSTSFIFGFNRTAGSISIDWGDGSSPTSKTSSRFTETISHTYTSAGLFVADVTFISGNVQLYASQTTWALYLVAFEAHALNPQVINNTMFPSISDFPVLKSAWFGDELTTVASLSTCISLERIRLSPNTANIIVGHFAGDSSLRTFVVPSSVSSIAKRAFEDCVSLKEIHLLPTTPPTLAANKQSSDSAFYNTPSDMVIYVPSGCLTAYQSATNWSTFASQMQEESS